MSTSEEQGFLDAILAEPDRDGHRLIYADWLEENGNPERAEFIRIQIERELLPHWHVRQIPLKVRERELLNQHAESWKKNLPELEDRVSGVGGMKWGGFKRGFVADAWFDSFDALKKHASQCWDATPLDAVSVRCLGSIKQITPVPQLRELHLHAGFVDSDRAQQFAQSPVLSTLRTLSIPNCHLGAEGFAALLDSPHLGNLVTLLAPSNFLGNAGINALPNAVSLDSLDSLDLSEVRGYGQYDEDPMIDSQGMEALAQWPKLKQIRSLNLSGNLPGSEGIFALLDSPYASGLKALALRSCSLSPRILEEFAEARENVNLDFLDLGDNLLTTQGTEHLAKASCLRNVKVLNVDRCEISSEGMQALAPAPFRESLHRLNLNYNGFGLPGIRPLAQQSFPNLNALYLLDNDLGDDGTSLLVESPMTRTLQELDLSDNDIGGSGLEALKYARHLQNLLILRLSFNSIYDWDLDKLWESPLGKQLAILDTTNEGDGESIPF